MVVYLEPAFETYWTTFEKNHVLIDALKKCHNSFLLLYILCMGAFLLELVIYFTFLMVRTLQ